MCCVKFLFILILYDIILYFIIGYLESMIFVCICIDVRIKIAYKLLLPKCLLGCPLATPAVCIQGTVPRSLYRRAFA